MYRWAIVIPTLENIEAKPKVVKGTSTRQMMGKKYVGVF